MTISELLALWKAEDASLDHRMTTEYVGYDKVSMVVPREFVKLLRERTTALETAIGEMPPNDGGTELLQAVLDAINGTLDRSTEIADHPNVKFAQMQRLKWEEAALPPALPQHHSTLRGVSGNVIVQAAPPQGIETECCEQPIAADQRYCPKCGWEARIKVATRGLREELAEAKLAAQMSDFDFSQLTDDDRKDLAADLRWWANSVAKMDDTAWTIGLQKLLREAANALPPAHGWQPVETAPENELVLIHDPSLGHPATAEYRGGKWPWFYKPTHWMPLPDSPTAHGWHAEKDPK